MDEEVKHKHSPRVLKDLGLWMPLPMIVLFDEGLSPSAKLLYALLQQMNFNSKKPRFVWPSQLLIRGFLRKGRTQTVSLFKELESRSLIHIFQKDCSAGKSNEYYVVGHVVEA